MFSIDIYIYSTILSQYITMRVRTMKGFIHIKNGFYGAVISSLVLLSSNFGMTAYAADTGGYPWADAELIRASTYDWGYKFCQPDMVQARTCSTHYGYKDGIRYHESDPWKYDVRNCTSFVAWRINQTYKIEIQSWGNANNWVNVARKQGYSVSTNARVGDIAVWNGGEYGHVAYVTDVNLDGSVNVEQYNKAGRGEFSRQSRVHSNVYIHIAPAIVAVPPIEIPAISLAAVQSVSESLPIKPLPEDKPIVQSPTPAEVVQPIVTPEFTKPEIIQNQDVSYHISTTTDNEVKAYAIKHKNTKSGKVEIHTSDVINPEATWSAETITPEPVGLTRETTYAIADHNADGVNDMYQITYANTESKKVEVSILDGSQNYARYLSKWTSVEAQHTANDVWYEVADYNGDGSLDLYQIWHNNTANMLVQVSVLDGKSGFTNQLTKYELPSENHDALDAYYMIGDHNDDGKIDIFQISHNKTKSGKTEIKVFDGREPQGATLSRWTSDQPLYRGNGPNLL